MSDAAGVGAFNGRLAVSFMEILVTAYHRDDHHNTPASSDPASFHQPCRQRWRQTGNQYRDIAPPPARCNMRRNIAGNVEAITPVKQFRITASINKPAKSGQ